MSRLRSTRLKYDQIVHSLSFINNEENYESYLKKLTEVMFFCPHKGYGLVAREKIAPNHFIGFYAGKLMICREGEIALTTKKEKSFLLFLQNGMCLDGNPMNPISMANDKKICYNSVMKKIDQNLVGLFATSNGIEVGEEISYSYKDGFPRHMPWRKNKPLGSVFQNDNKLPQFPEPSSVCYYCKSLNMDQEMVNAEVDSIPNSCIMSSNYNETEATPKMVNSIEKSVNFIENSVDSIENSVDSIENSVDSIENSVDSIENSVDSIENSVDSIENSVDSIENSVDSIPNSAASLEESYFRSSKFLESQTNANSTLFANRFGSGPKTVWCLPFLQ